MLAIDCRRSITFFLAETPEQFVLSRCVYSDSVRRGPFGSQEWRSSLNLFLTVNAGRCLSAIHEESLVLLTCNLIVGLIKTTEIISS